MFNSFEMSVQVWEELTPGCRLPAEVSASYFGCCSPYLIWKLWRSPPHPPQALLSPEGVLPGGGFSGSFASPFPPEQCCCISLMRCSGVGHDVPFPPPPKGRDAHGMQLLLIRIAQSCAIPLGGESWGCPTSVLVPQEVIGDA